MTYTSQGHMCPQTSPYSTAAAVDGPHCQAAHSVAGGFQYRVQTDANILVADRKRKVPVRVIEADATPWVDTQR